jgi:ParB family chromosome partitioning protein
MAKTVGNLNLAGFGDIFNVETPNNGVTEIALNELRAPDCHPFRVNNDEQMKQLVESVREYGVREPGLARPHPNGGYELLCGNRRKMACELAGLDTMPVIIQALNDDLAVIAMVDSNLLHRDVILPSERGWAYKMRMDALNHNGVKGDRYSCDVMAEQTGESKAYIFRMMRLTELVETLLDKVDNRELAITPAVKMANTTKSPNVRVFNKFEYHLSDLDCSLCVYWRKKNGCSCAICPYEDIREDCIENRRQALRLWSNLIMQKGGWNRE